MLEPSSILSYYPKYSILDSIVKDKYKQLNIYIDLKNCLQSIYMEHVVKGLVENSEKENRIDSSVLSSVISFLSFHKIYALKRGYNIKFYIFYDLGSSSWHLNIHKGYKAHRRSDDLYGLSRERIHLYFKILQQNYLLIESLCKRIPNVYVSCLEHFEADFVPYYLIRNKLVDLGPDICHLIYSNDKDLHQILKLDPNVYQLARKLRTFHIVRKDRVMSFFLKRESTLPDEYFSIALAIQGDDGDEVRGIKGIGPASINLVMDYVIKMGNSVNEILDNAFNDKPLFYKIEKSPKNNVNKLLELIYNEEKRSNIVTRNLKLVDFEILSRVLDEYPKLEYREKAKKLRNSVLDKEVEKLNILKKAIDRSRIYFEEGALDILYA